MGHAFLPLTAGPTSGKQQTGPASFIRLRRPLQERLQSRKQFKNAVSVYIGPFVKQKRINQSNRTLPRCWQRCEYVPPRIGPCTEYADKGRSGDWENPLGSAHL